MAPIVLYFIYESPPVRAVMLTAKALGLELELKPLDPFKDEHLQPWYLKLNPIHTVPTIDDNGFIVYDSHAICGYLVNQYGKDDSLYPRDAKKRAIVDQRLHFNCGTMFPRLRAIVRGLFRQGEKEISEEKKTDVREAYDFLDKLLGSNKWMAGDDMTIADFSCVATAASLRFMVSGLDEHPNVLAWIERCRTTMTGYEEANQSGLDKLQVLFKSFLPDA